MSTTKILRSALAIAVLAACGGLHAQDAQSAPSVDSIIESLKADAPAAGPGQTRALRPGAAAPQLLSADLAAVRQTLGGPLPALVFDVPLSLAP